MPVIVASRIDFCPLKLFRSVRVLAQFDLMVELGVGREHLAQALWGDFPAAESWTVGNGYRSCSDPEAGIALIGPWRASSRLRPALPGGVP
jgi:hypothetical protein